MLLHVAKAFCWLFKLKILGQEDDPGLSGSAPCHPGPLREGGRRVRGREGNVTEAEAVGMWATSPESGQHLEAGKRKEMDSPPEGTQPC